MSFRKIVRPFCLGVIFSFLGLAAALAQDQEPLTNTDSGTVLFTKASPHSFKGIDPPFPPPKDFISEIMMNPKRTLIFMETDEATGTKFSLVNVVGGLPGGIPCVDGVNWPRGYEIVGEVPADVDLTNDAIAKSLVNKGKAALFSFCPEASPTEIVAVWLFKDEIPTHQSYNYEVYASWETQLPAAPGPRIKAEYHNKALEREHAKRLAESRVREATPARQSFTLPDPSPATPTISDRSNRDFRLIHPKKSDMMHILIIWAVAFLPIYLLIKQTRQTTMPHSSSSSGGYSSYDYSKHSKPDSEPEVNPIFNATKIDKAILSDDKILRGSSGKKVGRLEKAIFSNDQIIRDDCGRKVGRIEQSIWDSDKQIIKGADGGKEGEIKNDFWGNRIIVDKDGEKIGTITKNFWGETVIKKD